MLFGPDEIRLCPFCKTEFRIRTIASGNNLGSKTWSDGYTYAPMNLPDLFITQCLSCSEIFWIRDSSLIGELDNSLSHSENYFRMQHYKQKLRRFFRIPKNKFELWEEMEFHKFLDKDQLIKAVERRMWTSQDEERYLRMNLWWKMNDDVRNNSGVEFQQNETAIFESNLRALIGVFNKDESGILLKAEAYRELGKFEKCSEILASFQIISEILTKEIIEKANAAREMKVKLVYQFHL
jgi:hypothetical protein